MGKIRVLVVDDSVVVRRVVTDALAGDPDVIVAATAPNGRIALAKIPQITPDLITLDIEMPDMDGLTALAAIRKDYPRLPVIMFSTLTRRGAVSTLDALAAGATDYVTKPTALAGSSALAFVRAELLPRIKALCVRALVPAARPAATPASHLPRLAPAGEPGSVDVLAIGVSTGGPNALADLLPTLPADFPVPVVIVQHMPPMFTRLLAERLDARSPLRVLEAAPGEVVEPGTIWIAPGDFHMVVQRDGTRVRLATHQGPAENSCRPSVDVLFRSVADIYGAGTLGVVLTGMGQDGLLGAERIREHGGRLLVQDEATSVVWGMPGFVANAGLADAVLPLETLGPAIVRRVSLGRAAVSAAVEATAGI